MHIASALTPYMRNAAAAEAVQLLRNTFWPILTLPFNARLSPRPKIENLLVSYKVHVKECMLLPG